MKYEINKSHKKATKDFMRSVVESVDGIEGIDSGALEMLSYNYNVFIEQSLILKDEDMVITNVQGNLVTNPRVKIVKDAQASALSILKEFGLTLKSRTSVKAIVKDSEESPLEAFIKNKSKIESR